MRKKSLSERQPVFDATAKVDEAAGWAEALVKLAHQGPGDTVEAARHRASRKTGLPETVFWKLRYRRPKDILASVYFALKEAYEAECERQEARLRHELEMTKRMLGDAASTNPVVAEVEAALAAPSPAGKGKA